MSGEPILTFIVFACQVTVTPIPPKDVDLYADHQPGGCRVFNEEIVSDELMQKMTPMSCIMQSPVMTTKFMEEHPGWEPRKWTCRYVRPSQKI